jgi:uncharacterized protein YbbK (DUF523 family)
LLGEVCRYDGCAKENLHVKSQYQNWEIIPFCPEAPVLGTPRERISVIFCNKEYRVIGDKSGRDVTELLKAQTQKLIDEHPDLDKIVLKSKSPSCGIATTPILKADRALLCYDNGVAAEMLLEHFSDIDIVDENSSLCS